MVEKKSISVNPAFLKINSRGKSKTMKREKKNKPYIKPNTLKRDLINKVKDYQKKEKEKKRKQEKNASRDKEQDNNNFESEFKDSLEFLEKKISEKKKKNKQVITTTPQQNEKSSLTEISNIIVKNDVPYGILKGGKKPTYRQYIKNKTFSMNNKNFSMKNKIHINNKESLKIESIPSKNEEFEPRKSNLNNFKQDFLIKHNVIDLSKQNEKQKSISKKLPDKYIRRRKTRTKRNLGKKGGKIGILIKNNTTCKRIETDQEILKTSSLKEVKQHLRKRGLLKIGSSAPPDILRKIYEDSFLTGEVYNKNTGVLIHNYLNEENEE